MDEAAISGNRVGTDQSGALDVGNLVEGFKLDVDSDQNTFTSNVISGNGFAAVALASDSSGNVFEKNLIGTDAAGMTAIANGGGALEITGSSDTVIGSPGNGNVISGNTGGGIDLSSSSDTIIEGNMLGLGADGMTALGNGGTEIVVAGGSGTIIGGTSFGSNNYIASNGAEGIRLESTSATSILGNTIGASASGSLDRGNATSGIWVKSGVTGTVIGSTVAGNFIVGNDGDGILLSATTSGTTIRHNTIGQFSMPNGESGIEISDSSGNTIGGVAANQGNAIVGNTRDGVTVGGAAATDNSIRGSGMIGNGSLAADLGIDLGPDGVNLNDAGDGDVGANDLQNFPILASAVPSGGVSQVSGTLDTVAGTFTIDLYRVVTCDTGGNGEGQLWIGSGSTTAGPFTINATETVPQGLYITATATSSTGDTSEFSPCFLVTAADPLVVTTTADSGSGSLRDAIDFANTNAGPDTISFDIAGSGTHTISPLSALPDITSPVTIDGTSQPGFVGCPSAPAIEIEGTGAGSSNGLSILVGGSGSIIEAVAINRFSFDGIFIEGASNVTVQCTVIGLDPAGMTDLGNGVGGIRVADGDTNLIGGPTAADRNLVSGNGNFGIAIEDNGVAGDTFDNVIQRNDVGVDASGLVGIPSGSHAVVVQSAKDNQVLDNVIAEAANGLTMANVDATGNIIRGNFIGTDRTGTVDLGNTNVGIRMLVTGGGNIIGGTGTGDANVIANSGLDGILVGAATGAETIRANSIHDNGDLGIDVSSTMSGTGDGITDPRPEILSAEETAGTFVTGSVPTGYAGGDVDIFRVAVCDPLGAGEGDEWLATEPASGGTFSFSDVAVVAGDVLTVTASNPGVTTSEFSDCFTVTTAGASVDLSLTATAVSALTVTPGDDLVVDVMVTNGGPDTTPDATITATLDPELHFVANAGEYTCTEVASVLTCTTGLIPDLASVTDSIVLRATADADREVATLLSFTVAPDATVDDSNNTNDSDAVSYTVDHPCNDSDACLWVLEPSRAADPLAVPSDPPAGQPREFLLLDARAASWSDNGRIAFARGSNIWTSDSAGGDLEQVTDNVGPFDDRPAMAGSRIAFGSVP